jgi:enoyl-[acyl-carrier protein] reductase II
MFEGDLSEGELEIGQIASYIHEILPVDIIMKRLIDQYCEAQKRIKLLPDLE